MKREFVRLGAMWGLLIIIVVLVTWLFNDTQTFGDPDPLLKIYLLVLITICAFATGALTFEVTLRWRRNVRANRGAEGRDDPGGSGIL